MVTFKKALMFCAVALLLGGISVYGMNMIAPRESPKSVTVEGVNEELGLKLTMTLDKTVFQLGEPVNITFAITNISNETIRFIPRPGRGTDFLVYNETHSDVYLKSRFFGLPGTSSITLSPEESVGGKRQWKQVYNNHTWEEFEKGEHESPVSPGTYYIVGRSQICGINGQEIFPWITIETEPVEMIIG